MRRFLFLQLLKKIFSSKVNKNKESLKKFSVRQRHVYRDPKIFAKELSRALLELPKILLFNTLFHGKFYSQASFEQEEFG